jgi:hypothetical protein
MAAKKANKPKGIIDDIGKQIARLLKKGTPDAMKKARELQGIQRQGMDSKFKGQGAKQSADETAAMTAARLRAERKKNFTQSGGRNAPDRIDARKKAAENRAKNARKKPRDNKK